MSLSGELGVSDRDFVEGDRLAVGGSGGRVLYNSRLDLVLYVLEDLVDGGLLGGKLRSDRC